MADIVFVGQFIASKVGKTGLSPTVDVDRYTISDGSRTALVTAGSATEGRRGLYHYRLASADLSLYQYVATFITADATVDQQEIAAIGLVVPDALVSSRLAPATAGRMLEVAATGEASANVTYSAGVALTGRLAQVTDLPAAAPTAAAVADAVWDEAIAGHLTSGTTGAKLNTASAAAGAGSTAYTNTVTDDGSNPLDGVEVWITSDSGGASTVASTTTNTLGAFTVYLDPGTYYLWLAKGGYNFPNPTTITVT